MMSLDEVAALATSLPEVTVGERFGMQTWFVRKKGFAWERPFSKADVKRFGSETPPAGPILGVVVADLHEKEAILAAGTKGIFTIPHFDGYAALLIQLNVASKKVVREAVIDAWLACAPKKLADDYVATQKRK